MSDDKTFYSKQFRKGTPSTNLWNEKYVDESMKDQLDENGNPVYPYEPERENYQFDGWEPELDKVTGDETYTAKYKLIADKFLYFLRSKHDGIKEFPEISIRDDTLTTIEDVDYGINSYISSQKRMSKILPYATSYSFKNFRGFDKIRPDSGKTMNFIYNPFGGYHEELGGYVGIVHDIEIDIPNFRGCYNTDKGTFEKGCCIYVNKNMNKQDEIIPGITTYKDKVLDFLSYGTYRFSAPYWLTVNPQCKRLIAYNNALVGCLYTGVGPEEVFMPYLKVDSKSYYKNTADGKEDWKTANYSYAFPNTIKLWWAGELDQISENYLLMQYNSEGKKVNSLEKLFLTSETRMTEYNIREINEAYDIPYDATVWVPKSMLSQYLSDEKWGRVINKGLQIKAFDDDDTPQEILDIVTEVEYMKVRQTAYTKIENVAKSMGKDKQEEIYMKRDWLKWCAGKGDKPSWCNTSNGTEIPEEAKYPYDDFYWDIPRPDSEEAIASIDPPEIHRYFTNTLNSEDKKKMLQIQNPVEYPDNYLYRNDTSYACNGLYSVDFGKPPFFQFDSLAMYNDMILHFLVDFSSQPKGSDYSVKPVNRDAIMSLNFINEDMKKYIIKNYPLLYRSCLEDIGGVKLLNNNRLATVADLSDEVYDFAGASQWIREATLPEDILDWPKYLLAYSQVRVDKPDAFRRVMAKALYNTNQYWNGTITRTLNEEDADEDNCYSFACNLFSDLTYLNGGSYKKIKPVTNVMSGHTLTYDGFNFENNTITESGSTGTIRLRNIPSGQLNKFAEMSASLDVDNINIIHNSSYGVPLFSELHDTSKGLSVNGEPYTDLVIPDTVIVPEGDAVGYNKFAFSNIETISDWGGVKQLGEYNFCGSKLKGILEIPKDVIGYKGKSGGSGYGNFNDCEDLEGVKFKSPKKHCESAISGCYKFNCNNSTKDFSVELPETCNQIQSGFFKIDDSQDAGIFTITCKRYEQNNYQKITELVSSDSLIYNNVNSGKLKVFVPIQAIDIYKEQWNSKLDSEHQLPDSVFVGYNVTPRQKDIDTTPAYSKSVPSGAVVGDVQSVGGKSVAFWQIIANPQEEKSTNIKGSYMRCEYRPDASFYFRANRKYLLRCFAKTTDTDVDYSIGFSDNKIKTILASAEIKESYTVLSAILTTPIDLTPGSCFVFVRVNGGSESSGILHTKNFNTFDLTQMFGAGNEPTAEQFEAMFPADYYPYTPPTIISADVESVEIGGKSIPIPAAIRALPGYGWSAGNVCNEVDFERKVYVQRVGKFRYDGNTDLTCDANFDYTTAYNYIYSRETMNLAKTSGQSISVLGGTRPTTGTSSAYVYGGQAVSVVISVYIPNQVVSGNTKQEYINACKSYIAANPIDVYYELLKPIETDISSLLDDRFESIEVEGGGSVTFKQADDTKHLPVPNTINYYKE